MYEDKKIELALNSSQNFKAMVSQLAHNVVTTLGFDCILVTTSDSVVTMWSQRCVSNVVTTTKN